MHSPYSAEILSIDEALQRHMHGRSWHDHPSCPAHATLRLLRLAHHDFAGGVRTGELVVAASVADEVTCIFARLFEAAFPIERMDRIDVFDGNDDASMAANNSSGFNFRLVSGTSVLSQHALGLAIDLNPVQNPWLRAERVDPPAGRAYLDRTALRKGMIVRPGPVLDAFAEFGWQWGGDFRDLFDYHHFSKLPR